MKYIIVSILYIFVSCSRSDDSQNSRALAKNKSAKKISLPQSQSSTTTKSSSTASTSNDSTGTSKPSETASSTATETVSTSPTYTGTSKPSISSPPTSVRPAQNQNNQQNRPQLGNKPQTEQSREPIITDSKADLANISKTPRQLISYFSNNYVGPQVLKNNTKPLSTKLVKTLWRGVSGGSSWFALFLKIKSHPNSLVFRVYESHIARRQFKIYEQNFKFSIGTIVKDTADRVIVDTGPSFANPCLVAFGLIQDNKLFYCSISYTKNDENSRLVAIAYLEEKIDELVNGRPLKDLKEYCAKRREETEINGYTTKYHATYLLINMSDAKYYESPYTENYQLNAFHYEGQQKTYQTPRKSF